MTTILLGLFVIIMGVQFIKHIAILIALIVSPLTANAGYGLAYYIRSPNDFLRLVELEGIYHAIGPDIYVTGFAYVIALVFGLPMYLFLRWIKWDYDILILLWAAFVGGAITYFERFGISQWHWEFGALPALFVSLTAILILKISNYGCKKI